MNNTEYNQFLQLVDKQIDYGHNQLYAFPPKLKALLEIASQPIAFVERPLESKSDEEEAAFMEKQKTLRALDARIVTQNYMKCVVVSVETDSIELSLMKEAEAYSDFFFYMPIGRDWPEWYPLEVGDQVMARLIGRKGNQVECDIVAVPNERKYQKKQRKRIRDFSLDLQCMAGHLLMECQMAEMTPDTDYTSIRLKHYEMPVFGNLRSSNLHNRIFRPAKIDSNIVIWVRPAKQQETEQREGEQRDDKRSTSLYNISANNTFDDKELPLTPKVVPQTELSDVEGRVCGYGSPGQSQLMWVSLGNGSWRNNVFANYLMPGSDFKWLLEQRKIARYYPLGFPARFKLDVNRTEKKLKLRLLLCGVSEKIDGRLPQDSDTKDLTSRMLCESVLVSPFSRDTELLGAWATNVGYVGFINNKDMPAALVRYTSARLFSTEMKVPARVYLRPVEKGKARVVLNVKEALVEERDQLQQQVGKKIELKVCAISSSMTKTKVYLTSQGGFPIEYLCAPDEQQFFREKMFQKVDFRLLEVKTNFNAKVILWKDDEHLKSYIGCYLLAKNIKNKDGMQCMQHDDINCVVDLKTLHEGETVEDGALLRVIDVDKGWLVLAAHVLRHGEKIPRQMSVTVIRKLEVDHRWLCLTAGGRVIVVNSSEMADHLIDSLSRLYGSNTTIFVNTEMKPNGETTFTFANIACGGNYSRLLSKEPFPLQVPLSEASPRVLYYDVVVTAPTEDLQKGESLWVKATGEVDELGNFICLPDRSHEAAKAPSADSLTVIGRVESVSGGVVTFDLGDRHCQLSTPRELSLPQKAMRLADKVYKPGSRWRLVDNDGALSVDNRCPKRAMPYEVLACYAHDEDDYTYWIVRSPDGVVAPAMFDETGNNQCSEGQHPILEKRGTIDGLVSVQQVKVRLLQGRELPVRLTEIKVDDETDKPVFVCEPLGNLTLSARYFVRADEWSWATDSITAETMQRLKGATFKARITSIPNRKRSILSRKCLLPQCELIAGQDITGVCLMKVVGLQDHNFVLQQNDVTALMPWTDASPARITNTTEAKEWFPKNYLLTVELSMTKTGQYIASWKKAHQSEMDEFTHLSSDTVSESIRNVWVDHIGTRQLYVRANGVIFPISRAQLHMWEGAPLDQAFEPGQRFRVCSIMKDQDGYFSLKVPESEKQLRLPTVGDVFEATVLDYLPGNDQSCYVQFGEWTATVIPREMSQMPIRPNRRPYPIGSRVLVKVRGIKMEDMRIYASIRDMQEHVDFEANPELRLFTVGDIVDDNCVNLADADGLPGKLTLDNSDWVQVFRANNMDLLKHPDAKSRPKPINSTQMLAVVDVSRKSYAFTCSLKPILLANRNLAARLPMQQEQTVEVTVWQVRANRIMVSYGLAVGYIRKEECIATSYERLTDIYQPQQTVSCVITGVADDCYRFEASIRKAHPEQMAELFAGLSVGKQMQVYIEKYDTQKGASVSWTNPQGRRLKGHIAPENIPGTDIEIWNNLVDETVWVVCTVVEADTATVEFSRTGYLNRPR